MRVSSTARDGAQDGCEKKLAKLALDVAKLSMTGVDMDVLPIKLKESAPTSSTSIRIVPCGLRACGLVVVACELAVLARVL